MGGAVYYVRDTTLLYGYNIFLTYSTSQNHISSQSQYQLPSNAINHDQNGKMTHLGQHSRLSQMLLPFTDITDNASSMLFIAPQLPCWPLVQGPSPPRRDSEVLRDLNAHTGTPW